ncbi:MAG TPA: hypothetical protein VIC53_08695, partial [Wenzhouxiangella sp.]
MHRPAWVFIALVAWVLQSASLAQDPSAYDYVILTEDRVIGSLKVLEQSVAEGMVYETHLAVSENGRGPSLSERIVLDDQGGLLAWEIEGHSTFGAPVDERYRFSVGQAQWVSVSESGAYETSTPPIFVPQAATDMLYPYLIRQAVAKNVTSLEVLPFGEIRIEPLPAQILGAGLDQYRPYLILGLTLEPVFVVLDQAQRLVARLGTRQWLLSGELKDQAQRWMAIDSTLVQARLKALARSIGVRPKARVIYDRVHLILPKKSNPSDLTRVSVVDGRIQAIGPTLPILDQDIVIDGEGGYLMPGLFDLHVHTSPWSGLYHLAAGVTGVRDQGTPMALMHQYLAWHANGDSLSPTIYPSGLVEGLSPYSTQSGQVVDSIDQALAAIDDYAASGYRQIKFYNSIRPEWVKPMIQHAHALGLKVTGHVPAFMNADQAIEAGYDDISHLNQLMLGWVLEPDEDTRTPLRITAMARVGQVVIADPKPQHTLDRMVEHNVALDTTAMILERVFLSRSGRVTEADQPYLDHMPLGYQRFRRQAILSIDSAAIDQAYAQAVTKSLEVMKAAYDRGVQLLPGTDDGIGFSLHRELELYVQMGIAPADAIYLATLGAA